MNNSNYLDPDQMDYDDIQTVVEAYPSVERFEEILAEAELNARTPDNQAFVRSVRLEYLELGEELTMNRVRRLRLRQLSTGALR